MITARWGNCAAGVAAGVVVGMALSLGSAGAAGADPYLVPSPTPKPTATVEGGAATAGATTAAAAATEARPTGDVLDQLAEEYAVGSGGGQLSNLLKASLKMRAMGYRPSRANLEALSQAMRYRPNQLPMIQALKDTIAYQQKVMAQTQILQRSQGNANSAVMGAGPMPSDSNPALIPGAPAPVPMSPTSPMSPMSP